MTATVPEDDEYRNYLMKLAPIRFHLSLDECVALGLVSPYEIVCIPLELNEEDKKEYKAAQLKFVRSKYLIGEFDSFTAAKLILAKKMQGDMGAAKRFFQAIRERTNVINHAGVKIDKAKEPVKEHADSKILIFTGSNKFSDAMAESLDAFVYHSGLTKKQREKSLEDFRGQSNAVLCSTKALNQGFDVPDASIGIIAGLNSKSLPMIQRVGRLLRLSTAGKIGKIYIVYIKDSQEEKWLKNAVKTLNNVTWL
jgi:superfamily II DNA or RNA helicase